MTRNSGSEHKRETPPAPQTTTTDFLGVLWSHLKHSTTLCQTLTPGIVFLFSILARSGGATSPLSICHFMDVAVMSVARYTHTHTARHTVEIKGNVAQTQDSATGATPSSSRRHAVMNFVLVCLIRLMTFDPHDLSVCFTCRSQHPRRPGGGSTRPTAHASGQHAAGRGRGRTGEGRGIGGGRCRGCSVGRRRRQLDRTFRLSGQTHPDQTDLPHGAGEV